jgi:hypothetical protein
VGQVAAWAAASRTRRGLIARPGCARRGRGGRVGSESERGHARNAKRVEGRLAYRGVRMRASKVESASGKVYAGGAVLRPARRLDRSSSSSAPSLSLPASEMEYVCALCMWRARRRLLPSPIPSGPVQLMIHIGSEF